MTKSYTNLIVKHCRWVVLACLIVIGAVTTGALKLSLTNEYEVFFNEDNPELLQFENVQKTYNRSDNIMIMLLPKSGNVFEQDTLNAVLELTDKAWQFPFATRVDSLTNFQHSYGLDDDLFIEDLYSGSDDDDIERIKKIALNDPVLLNRIVSPSGHATAINIAFKLEEEFDTPVAVKAVREDLAVIKDKYPQLQLHVSGVLMQNISMSEAMVSDQLTVIPIVLLVVMLTAMYYLRSVYLTFVSVALVSMAIAAAMGTAGWFGVVLSPPTACIAPCIMTVAVATCLHILLTFQQKRQEGLNQTQAIMESMDLNLNPVFLTSITTVLGFLCLNFSDSPPFREFGTLSAVGVLFSFILSMTFLPAMLAWRKIKAPTHDPLLSKNLGNLAGLIISHRKWILSIGLALAVGLAALAPRNDLDDNFIHYFGNEIQFRVDSDAIVDELTGIYYLQYSLDSGVTDGVADPVFLAKVEQLEKWLLDQPEVFQVDSILPILRKLHFNLHADDQGYYKLPDSKESIAQYLLLYEMSLPTGLDLNGHINVNKSATRLTVPLQTISSTEMIEFEDRVSDWIAANTPALSSTQGVSPSMMFSNLSIRNVQSMMISTIVALALISFFLILPLRSVRHGLLSLVSNILPGLVALGIWWMMVGKISMGVSVVIPMTLGVVVDDTIHLISKYLRARREMGLSSQEAIRYSFETVGVALVATTVVLVAGFLVLLSSDFQLNSHLGIVSALTVLCALLVDFFIIPPLLLLMDSRSDRKHPEGFTET